MSPEILIVRDGEGYRLLHGHLNLARKLFTSNEVVVEVKHEGEVKVIKTRNGFFVGNKFQILPLRRN